MEKPDIVSPYASFIDWERYGMSDLSRVLVFDTTLRDGEQSPGASMGPPEKAHVARHIHALNVDAMEVSFGESDPGEIESTRQVIEATDQSEDQERREDENDIVIYSLSRTLPASIDKAWEAVKSARLPGLHTVIATSDTQIGAKFPGKDWREIKKMLVDSTDYMARLISDSGKYGMVEVSAEDATRTPIERLIEIYTEVMEAARPYMGKVGFTFNIPDTVGAIVSPEWYGRFIDKFRHGVPDIAEVITSVHVHNDHGLALPLSLAGIANGATQVEVAVNGIGERAGNASLEQVVMALKHDDISEFFTGIKPRKIYAASVEVAAFTGYHPSPNQPCVGSNAHAHESGIHQDGEIKGRKIGQVGTYEGIAPEEIGAPDSRYTLGKRSGINAVQYHLELIGYPLEKTPEGKWNQEERDKVYAKFIEFAQTQDTVTDVDLRDNVMAELGYTSERPIPFEYISHTVSDNPGGTLKTRKRAEVLLCVDGGEPQKYIGHGSGEMGAVFDAMNQALDNNTELKLHRQNNKSSIGSEGIASIAKTEVTLYDKLSGEFIPGQGYDLDIGISAAKAIATGLNLKLMVQRAA